jgi:plasmid stabilization system protein ParE
MNYEYIFLRKAQEEYESAFNWYLERSIKAAENFVNAVELTVDLICEHPDRWRNEVDDFFELGLKKYPYTIVYTFEEDKDLVVISSVYHQSKNPKKKYQ